MTTDDLLKNFPGGAERLTPQQRAIAALFIAAGIIARTTHHSALAEHLTDEFERWGAAEGLEP